MGKSARLKKQKQQMVKQQQQQPPLMSPELIKAYTRGRAVGEREGRVEGAAEVMLMFNGFIESIDEHVKGIGPKTKIEIEKYLADRIKDTIENHQLQSAKVRLLKDIPQDK